MKLKPPNAVPVLSWLSSPARIDCAAPRNNLIGLQLARPRWHVTARIHTLCLWFTAAQFCRLSTVADSVSRNDVQTCRKGFLATCMSTLIGRPALLRTFNPCDHPSQHCSYSASEVLVEQRPIVPETPRRSQGHQEPGGTTHPGAPAIRDAQQRLASVEAL